MAAAAVIATLVVGGGVALAFEQAATARERDRAQAEATRATQVTNFLLEMFGANDPGLALGDSTTVRQVLDRAASRVSDQMADQPDVQARLLSTMGQVYRSIGLPNESRSLLEEAAAVHGEHPGAALEYSDVLNELGSVSEDLGDHEAAEGYYLEALALRERELDDPHTEISAVLQNLGLLYSNLSRPDEAEPLLRRAVEMDRGLMVGDTSGALGYSLNSLAILRYTQGDLDEAANLLEESLSIRRATYGPLHPRVATSLGNLAAILTLTGDFERADPFLRETLDMNRQLHGEAHPDIANSLHNLAANLGALGRFDEAEALAREAMRQNRSLLADEHPEVALNLNLLGTIHRDRGDLAEAYEFLDRAVAMASEVLPPGHLRTAIVTQNRGTVLALQSRCEEAAEDYRNAVSMYAVSQGENSYRTALAQIDLASCLTTLGDYPEAEAILLSSLPLLVEQRGEDGPEADEARRYLEELYSAWGRPERAAVYRDPGSAA